MRIILKLILGERTEYVYWVIRFKVQWHVCEQ